MPDHIDFAVLKHDVANAYFDRHWQIPITALIEVAEAAQAAYEEASCNYSGGYQPDIAAMLQPTLARFNFKNND